MGKIRIIGGNYRSRVLPVLDLAGLRPTLDRVKETLFNWLNQDLTGMMCLDLFAGSGSLGFEAISRNAKAVYMVEKDAQVVQNLKRNLDLLQVINSKIINTDALDFLKNNKICFDVIFLDPPYNGGLLKKSLDNIARHLTESGVIYIEFAIPPANIANFDIIKQSKAGTVKYCLLKKRI